MQVIKLFIEKVKNLVFKKFRYKLLATFLFGNLIASLIVISSYILVGRELHLLTFSLLTIVAALFAVLIDYFISQPVTNTIDKLISAAKKVARGNFEEGNVSVEIEGELLELVETFNLMNQRLDESFQKQKQMEQARKDLIKNITHDIKTPLATIQLFAESIVDGVLEEEELEEEYLKTIIDEAHNIQTLLDQLTRLSDFEAGEVDLDKERVDLVDLICNFLKSAQVRFEKKELDIQVDAPARSKDEIVYGDKAKIYQVIANLINNAIKYTPSGGEINVRIVPKNDGIKVEVIDNGIGIPEKEQDRIFERFYQVDKARSRDKKGSGLGLAIVKEIVELHGGQVWVESELEKGSTFSFNIPRPDKNKTYK